jgi:mannose-6-phosphate isomerase
VNTENKPQAELWLGAHDNAPSIVKLATGDTVTLNDFLNEDSTHRLGNAVASKFGRLPYLFKVLDVKDMLSIQVHPSKKAAEKEFAAENERGVSLKAPNRNYKDDNHKPELMFALSDFWLLHGFKEQSKLTTTLAGIPELKFLLPIWEKDEYEGIYKTVMEMSAAQVNSRLQPLIDRILPLYEAGKLDKNQPDFWAARAYKTFCKPGELDRGIFSIYFFNVVHLKKGEAIFQDAGILHAYLEGQNLEIMANSDNVLRGGLTNKHVDVAELLKHVSFVPVNPAIIEKGHVIKQGLESFPTPAADFELQKVSIGKKESVTIKTDTADIYLVLEGVVEAIAGSERVSLHKGQALLALANTALSFTSEAGSLVFRATVPYSQS